MTTKEDLLKRFWTVGIAIMITMPFTACNTGKTINATSTWEIAETTSLKSLTIEGGAVLKAPEGYSLTMTVDGVETPIAAGEYNGNIVLTPTENIFKEFDGMGIKEAYYFRAAIDVENGKYMPGKSVASAVASGEVTDSSAKDIKITSVGKEFNGIIATGDSEYSYSIINPEIDFTGNGGNDFAGYGAGIMSDGNAKVTVENAKITTRGAIRTAVWVGGNSVTNVNNSVIEVQDGTLPADYTGGPVAGGGGVMMDVPWMLGLTGNCRATMACDSGTVYYNNTQIKAQAWGALSTDSVKKVRLYATDCIIEVIDSGYGAYADGDSIDTFSGCTFNVHDMALIMTGGSGVFTDGTVVNSGRFGVMMHSSGTGTLTIDKGSVFNAKQAAIQVKTCFPTIVVDNAKLNSETGVILQVMVDDNPNMAGGSTGGAPDMGGPGPGAPGGDAGAGGPGGGMPGGPVGHKDITATFKNTDLNGDIVSSMTSLADVIVSFEKATITGAVTTATIRLQTEIDGVELSRENYRYIGEGKNTYCSTDDKYGVTVSLDGDSKWVVDKTSYLTGLTIAKGAVISAPEGYSVTLTVNGAKKAIGAGDYKGRIVLTVNKI